MKRWYKISYCMGALLMLVACSHKESITKWKEEAILRLHQGEFNAVDSIIEGLNDDIKARCSIEIDSIKQIMARIYADFSLSSVEGRAKIKEMVPYATDSLIEEWISKRYIETIEINGQDMWFRKSVRNLRLIDVDDFAEFNKANKDSEVKNLVNYYNSMMSTPIDDSNVRNWHSAEMTFKIDVKADAVPHGKKVRVWLPFPFDNGRQRNIKLLSTSHAPTMSQGSVHHTVYMEAGAVAGQPTHFEIRVSYEVGGQYFAADDIMRNLKPYDVESDIYKQYTSSQYPHIIISDKMKELAHTIVGDATNPVVCAGRVYDYIVARYPWAGARDYSTIPNIPEYVLSEGHGDCGQVSLLYITLLRAIGIPARWESGWMLHPGDKNLHDWCEVYFEGTGWVPCDVSFGRTTKGTAIKDYYKTGTDIYRFATNEGVNGVLSPAKRYIRCETVDFQLGEVEWDGGNLPMDKWDSQLIINKFEPLTH